MKKFLGTISFSVLLSTITINTAFAEILLFVGDGCSHCANVEQYMEANNILGRLPVTVYEVWNHPENQPIYMEKAQAVGYTGQGVPFMVDGNHYEVGDYPIIEYFGNLIENQDANTTAKLEEEAIPLTPEEVQGSVATGANTMTEEDSEDLNSIIEEKTEDGEKSELNDPSGLYDAANGVKGNKKSAFDEVKNMDDLLKSPLFYAIAIFVIVDVIVVTMIIRKRMGR